MARLDVELPVTREELEETLRQEGFAQQHGSEGGSVWWSQDRTKFVCFPDDNADEAVYGDAEIGEPGKTMPIGHAQKVIRGLLLLDSPLGVVPAQQRAPEALPSARAQRGLPPGDPLLELPAATDRGESDWYVRSALPRHETVRPPPSEPPSGRANEATRAFASGVKDAVKEHLRDSRMIVRDGRLIIAPWVLERKDAQKRRARFGWPVVRWTLLAATIVSLAALPFVPYRYAALRVALEVLVGAFLSFVAVVTIVLAIRKRSEHE